MKLIARCRRKGLALPIVVTLITVAFLGIAAVSFFRSSVSRQLDALIQGVRLIDVAEAAISEVAEDSRLNALLTDPSHLETFRRAFEEGTLRGGVLAPSGGSLEVEPDVVRTRLAARDEVELSAVTLRPVEYLVDRNRGRLRFLVTASLTRLDRVHTKRLAQDYEFTLYDTGGSLRIILADTPMARLYP